MKRIKLLFTLAVFIVAMNGIAQTEKKEHFIIHTNGALIDVAKHTEAISAYSAIDQFRFYDKRRIIKFTESEATVELLSAKELLEKYGKQIPPQTIMPDQIYKEITFSISIDGKNIKPQIK